MVSPPCVRCICAWKVSTRRRCIRFSAYSLTALSELSHSKVSNMAEVKTIRHAIIEALPREFTTYAQEPDARNLYVPPAHVKALRLECNLVVGARGVGKSFWTAALGSTTLRNTIGQSIREMERVDVRIGFSVLESIDNYPNADTFAQMLTSGITAYDIWRAVIVRWIAERLYEDLPRARWDETVAWLKANPEDVARLMQRANQHLANGNRFGLIVFDALDRTSDDWRTMDAIVRDLLRVALWLKSYSCLGAKVFLREDQFERSVTDFPDASKLLSTKTELTWARHDLHGLLWKMLVNGPDEHGKCLREIYRKVGLSFPLELKEIWQLADKAKRETPSQRALFETLAGPWMGRDKRRGVPYVWSVGHLADGRGRTSPRSFLAAIRQSAEDSLERYPEYAYALHYESIKRGIQKASRTRVDEMAEDYPWVRTFMTPLGGLTVPCDYSFILQRWEQEFPAGPDSTHLKRLPPQHTERGWTGIREDLARLGVFEIKKDGRIDMPDLYRVGFGLGRKGGVKPNG
ncbi:conserved hypothetical protein [Gammaproteobacteria bacterium]